MPARSARRWLVGSAVAVAIVVALVVAFAAAVQAGLLRNTFLHLVSVRAGRPITVSGALHIELLSFTPSITAEGVTIGNPHWMTPGPHRGNRLAIHRVRDAAIASSVRRRQPVLEFRELAPGTRCGRASQLAMERSDRPACRQETRHRAQPRRAARARDSRRRAPAPQVRRRRVRGGLGRWIEGQAVGRGRFERTPRLLRDQERPARVRES